MNSNVKAILAKVGGTLSYVGFPAVYAGFKWGFLTESTGTSLSTAVMAMIVMGLPVLRSFKSNLNININYMGVIVFIIGAMGYFLGEVMMWLGGMMIGGSVIGSFAFSYADKVKATALADKQATAVAEKMAALNKVET